MNLNTGIDRSQDSAVSTATYRPHLDGLRAVAVYLVVLFHAGSTRFPGGYVGVDVFFVLSGYLVTQLLLRDIGDRGSIRLAHFYARRFRRLLPAAFVALVVTALVYTAIASPLEVADSVGSFKAAFLYSTNWYFIHNSTGYFGANLSANPVLHFWSLAVEEQFYLLWPLTLGGLFVVTRRLDARRRMHAIRIVLAVGAVASATWALSIRNTNPNRAYYGTDARAYELLAGALIALMPAFVASAVRFRRTTRVASAASIAALVVVASSWVHLDAIERGIAVTIITCVLIVALDAAGGGPVNRALSTRPAVYLGRISYGTYLWHWIVILVLVRTFHPAPLAATAIACLVATAMASLSYEMLEQPVRTSTVLGRHGRSVIAAGLAISIVSALVVIPRIVDTADASSPAGLSAICAGFTPIPPSVDWRHANKGAGSFVSCYRKPASACTVVRGGGKRVLLMGDSQAQMLVPTFTAIARREDLTLSVSTFALCPWQRDVFPRQPKNSADVAGRIVAHCGRQKEDLYRRVIPELDPDVIVVMTLVGVTGPDWGRATARSVAQLRAGGRKVVIVEPIPRAPINPRDCLSQAKVLEECRYVARRGEARDVDAAYRQLARRNAGVFSADFDRLVCPFLPICDPVIGGRIVKWDSSHLTVAFAQSLAPQVDAYLKQTGVIPG